MKLPILATAQPGKSVEQGKQEVVNMYFSENKGNELYPMIAHSRPGLKTWKSNTGQSVRAMHAQNTKLYFIIGSTLYSIDKYLTQTTLGSILTTEGICQIKGIANRLLINDQRDGWIFNITTNVLTKIDPAQGFPEGTTTVTSLDGYFIAHLPDSDSFYWSTLTAPQTWAALDFSSAESNPDNIVAVTTFLRRLFFIGSNSTEIWFNTGDATSPFARIEGVFINYGTSAPHSVAVGAQNLYFLGQGNNGQLGIVSLDRSYNDKLISSETMTQELVTYTTVDDAIGLTYQREGKEFYVISFPTEDKTWVYDQVSDMWYRYTSWNGAGERRWLPDNHAAFAGKNLVGDSRSGNIYELDNETLTDNGEIIIRKIRTNPLAIKDMGSMFIHRVEVDIESGQGSVSGQGEDPVMMLRASLDGGFSFSNVSSRKAGKIGEYLRRVYWNKIGSSRRCVLEFTMSDPIKWTILGAWVQASKGRE